MPAACSIPSIDNSAGFASTSLLFRPVVALKTPIFIAFVNCVYCFLRWPSSSSISLCLLMSLAIKIYPFMSAKDIRESARTTSIILPFLCLSWASNLGGTVWSVMKALKYCNPCSFSLSCSGKISSIFNSDSSLSV